MTVLLSQAFSMNDVAEPVCGPLDLAASTLRGKTDSDSMGLRENRVNGLSPGDIGADAPSESSFEDGGHIFTMFGEPNGDSENVESTEPGFDDDPEDYFTLPQPARQLAKQNESERRAKALLEKESAQKVQSAKLMCSKS